LKRERRSHKAHIATLDKDVSRLSGDAQRAVEIEISDGPKKSFLEKVDLVRTMMTNISEWAAAAHPSALRGKTEYGDMRWRLGPMTDIQNGFVIASCGYIRSIGHDNGSVSEATICIPSSKMLHM
jgi:hypothetical protein